MAVANGSDFQIFEGRTPASELARTYRRRAEHVGAVGLDNGGFAEALHGLEAEIPGQVRLGQVTDRRAQRHYQLFLSPDADEVIGCLWVQHDD